MTDLVSIIIPIYNTRHYLRDCLDSVIKQSYQNLEILLVDDCSSDQETIDIIQEYLAKDSRFHLITNEKNSGPSYSRNNGVQKCHGDFFTFLDSDDMLHEDFVQNMLNIHKNNNVDFVVCTYQDISEDHSQCIHTVKFSKFYSNTKVTSIELINKKHLFKVSVNPIAKLFKTSWYKNKALSFVEGVLYEDQDWNIRLISNSKNFYITDYIGYFRVLSENSIMRSPNPQYSLTIIDAFYRVKHELEKLNLYKKYSSEFSALVIHTAISFIESFTDHKIKQEFKDIFFREYSKLNIPNPSQARYYQTYRIAYKVCKLLHLQSLKEEFKLKYKTYKKAYFCFIE